MITEKKTAARLLEMSETGIDLETKRKAYIELGFTSPPEGERYSGGSW